MSWMDKQTIKHFLLLIKQDENFRLSRLSDCIFIVGNVPVFSRNVECYPS